MTRKRKAKPAAPPAKQPPAPEPVDTYEGIPDCSPRRPLWRWVLMAGLFVGWLALLVYCWLAGGSPVE